MPVRTAGARQLVEWRRQEQQELPSADKTVYNSTDSAALSRTLICLVEVQGQPIQLVSERKGCEPAATCSPAQVARTPPCASSNSALLLGGGIFLQGQGRAHCSRARHLRRAAGPGTRTRLPFLLQVGPPHPGPIRNPATAAPASTGVPPWSVASAHSCRLHLRSGEPRSRSQLLYLEGLLHLACSLHLGY